MEEDTHKDKAGGDGEEAAELDKPDLAEDYLLLSSGSYSSLVL